MTTTLKQPIKWHGGKSYIAKRIIELMATHTHYTEPFAGGLAVLLAKNPEGVSETVNDLHRELSDFWQVLATTPDRMLRELWATPLSQDRWDAAQSGLADSDRVRRATAFFIRARQSRQGLMKDFATPTTRTRRGMNENVSAWLTAVDGLPDVHQRLRRVEIRNMDAVKFIQQYDHANCLHYVDPPYLHETRTATKAYRHEMTAAQHVELLGTLKNISGKFILSGYRSQIYDAFAEDYGWRRVDIEIDNKSSGAKVKEKKTECLWLNY